MILILVHGRVCWNDVLVYCLLYQIYDTAVHISDIPVYIAPVYIPGISGIHVYTGSSLFLSYIWISNKLHSRHNKCDPWALFGTHK